MRNRNPNPNKTPNQNQCQLTAYGFKNGLAIEFRAHYPTCKQAYETAKELKATGDYFEIRISNPNGLGLGGDNE